MGNLMIFDNRDAKYKRNIHGEDECSGRRVVFEAPLGHPHSDCITQKQENVDSSPGTQGKDT